MNLDIAGLSVALTQNQVKSDARFAMMKKVMNTSEGQNDALINMLDSTSVQATHPTTGTYSTNIFKNNTERKTRFTSSALCVVLMKCNAYELLNNIYT